MPCVLLIAAYLKESRPLALSRKRDAWLLAGAAGAGLLLLAFVMLGLLIFTKRKRAQSAVAAPPVLQRPKDEESVPSQLGGETGQDNAAYVSETEGRVCASCFFLPCCTQVIGLVISSHYRYRKSWQFDD